MRKETIMRPINMTLNDSILKSLTQEDKTMCKYCGRPLGSLSQEAHNKECEVLLKDQTVSTFAQDITSLIHELSEAEHNAILEAAHLMYDTMNKGLLVHTFATGHSHMFSEELFYRAGGLVQIAPILIPELMQHEGAITSTQLERQEGLAQKIYDSLDLKEGEPFIIVSNSGINAVPVEMAAICHEHHHKVIVITSMKTTLKGHVRNALNKHLYELGDIVIDNHAPQADGLYQKSYGKVGAVSTILNSFIAQALVLEVINLYEQNKQVPPVYQSANTEGGDEHNQTLITRYQARIKGLK